MTDTREKPALVECPHCGSKQFYVAAKAVGFLERNDKGKLIFSNPPNGFECGGNGDEELECAGCNTHYPLGDEEAFVRSFP